MLDVKRLQLRAAFFQAVRYFFDGQGFLEVDTPIRQPLVIPEQNISHIPSSNHFLQSSPELYMKRLLAGGCEQIYQICHCFRNGERGRLHLEEFVMLEWYRRDADYRDLMRDCEALIQVLHAALPNNFFPFAPGQASEYLKVEEAFVKYSSMSVQKSLEEDLFDELLVEDIEPHLGKNCPTFLYDYPLELASLARQKKGEPGVAERFELYVSGVELANGFSELTDPEIQRTRFQEEYKKMGILQESQAKMPEKFLESLTQLEQAAGIALGLDRLFMLFLGDKQLDTIISFAPDELDV
jgi:lysyl-tRNA synthetase class 2